MIRTWAIAKLAFWDGIRMRIVIVFLLVLAFLVLRLPFALTGDGTLTGRLQNFLDYALGAVGTLLALSTVLLSAATLSGEFKTNSLHMVITKPVARWQILLGKWIGVNLLNLLMLILCGVSIYGFARLIVSRPEATSIPDHQKVHEVLWTARKSASATRPDEEMVKEAAALVQQRIEQGVTPSQAGSTELEERFQQLDAIWRTIGPQEDRVYLFENLPPPRTEDEYVQVRFSVRARPLPVDEMIELGWVFLDPETGAWLHEPRVERRRSAQIHQFLVRSEVIRGGKASLLVRNLSMPEKPYRVTFEQNYPLQILYHVSTFEQNYLKTLGFIALRLGFLSALGVFLGTFVSFPVGAFCGLTWLLVCLGRPFWMEAIGANMTRRIAEIDPYGPLGPIVRPILTWVLRILFPDFAELSGNSRLIDGLYIANDGLLWGTAHVFVLGGSLLLVGWLIFREREVAEVTV